MHGDWDNYAVLEDLQDCFKVQNAVEHPLSYHLSPIFQMFRLDATWAGGSATLQIIIMAASTSPPQTERGSMENWDVIIISAAFNT